MNNRPTILYKKCRAWRGKVGEVKKEFVRDPDLEPLWIMFLWALELRAWGLPKLSGLETWEGSLRMQLRSCTSCWLHEAWRKVSRVHVYPVMLHEWPQACHFPHALVGHLWIYLTNMTRSLYLQRIQKKADLPLLTPTVCVCVISFCIIRGRNPCHGNLPLTWVGNWKEHVHFSPLSEASFIDKPPLL